MKTHITWLCAILLTLCHSLYAQNAIPEVPAEVQAVSGRKAWVVMMTIPKDLKNPLKILSAEKVHEVRMHMRSVGKPVKVDKDGIVRAVKLLFDEEGEETYQNLSYSKIPEGVLEALIILVPETENAEGLRFKSEVIDLSKFKKGGRLYVNLAKTKIGIKIGEEKKVIPSGGMEVINPLETKVEGVNSVMGYYEIPNEEEGEWKFMTSFKMSIPKSRREICIFFYNKQIENIDFRGIPFIIPKSISKPRKP
ncbi:MAG: hypothetical protein ACI9E1_001366 [Cryomorphaceae bacterium]|jgi:hypothetical protein